jgi:hypothetical protein
MNWDCCSIGKSAKALDKSSEWEIDIDYTQQKQASPIALAICRLITCSKFASFNANAEIDETTNNDNGNEQPTHF